MKKSLIITLVIGILIGSISFVNSEETKNEGKWIPITSFKIGIGENEIPNSDEGADLYFSPRGLFCDSKGNFFIFIGGVNQIKKISPKGILLDTYTIKDFGHIRMVFLDSKTDRIFALTTSKIIIFSTDMEFLGKIDITDLVKKEKTHPQNIFVYGKNVYLYLGINTILFDIDYNSSLNQEKVTYGKTLYIPIKDQYIEKFKPNFYSGVAESVMEAIYFKDKKRKLKLPNDFSSISSLAYYDSDIYLLIRNLIASTGKSIETIFIIRKNNTETVDLKESQLIYGIEKPLVCINNNNIYYLCCEEKKMILYSYRL